MSTSSISPPSRASCGRTLSSSTCSTSLANLKGDISRGGCVLGWRAIGSTGSSLKAVGRSPQTLLRMSCSPPGVWWQDMQAPPALMALVISGMVLSSSSRILRSM